MNPRAPKVTLITTYTLVLAVLALSVSITSGQAQSPAILDESLKLYLQNYLSTRARHSDSATRVSVASLNLQGGKIEEIVYVTGGGWCGATERCPVLFLEKQGDTYKLLGNVPGIQSPIYALSTQTNGHPDFAVSVGGGMTMPLDTVSVLTFDGSSYPSSAYKMPAILRRGLPSGSKEIISSNSPNEPLY